MAETQANNPVDDPKVDATVAAPKPQRKPVKKPEKSSYYWGTGRRKRSVARVRIRPGDGKLLINKRQLGDYFARTQDKEAVLAPLKVVESEKAFDVFVNVRGGGTTGQAGATRLGIARALKNYDENYIQPLRDGGYLTRDSRMIERKKAGKAGARKRFQFSKR
jgi:small subunit ribosomal protein S9